MRSEISKQTKHELLEVLRQRYQQAPKLEKTTILDEFVAIASCHRKHAIRLLAGVDPVVYEPPTLPRRIYSEAVREALIVLWEAADRICGKRLKAILPGLISALERNGHLAVDLIVRQHLLAVSPATIDRLLRADPRDSRSTPEAQAGYEVQPANSHPDLRRLEGAGTWVPRGGLRCPLRRLHAGDLLVELGGDRCVFGVDRGGPFGGPGAVSGHRRACSHATSVPGADPRDRH